MSVFKAARMSGSISSLGTRGAWNDTCIERLLVGIRWVVLRWCVNRVRGCVYRYTGNME